MSKLLVYLLLLIGLILTIRGGRATFSAAFADRYARTSPTASLWRRWLGVPRAVVAVHRVLGPLFLLVGLGLIVVALGRF